METNSYFQKYLYFIHYGLSSQAEETEAEIFEFLYSDITDGPYILWQAGGLLDETGAGSLPIL